MKRILFIPAQFYPIPAIKGGAVEVLLTQLIEENEKHHRADFFIISKNDSDAKKFKYNNSKVIYFKNNSISKLGFFFVRFCRKLVFNRFTKKCFKNTNYGFKELTYFGYKCKQLSKRINPDIIVSESYDKIHQLWPLVKKYGNDNFYYHLHYTKQENKEVRRMFPNTIAISEYVLNQWVKDLTIAGKNTVLFNGIDLNAFSKQLTNEQKQKIRAQYNLGPNDFVVLFTGRLRPHKGVLELLQAFDKVRNDNIKLLIAGDFLSESKEHSYDESDFENKCLSIIEGNKNIVRTGNVSYDFIPSLYSISNIQIIPSMWEEGAGLVAIEGMANGLPLIITKSGGMPEYTGKECAIILDRDEKLTDNIADSILKLFDDADLRQKMSLAGIERSKLFSKEKYFANYMNILLGEEKNND